MPSDLSLKVSGQNKCNLFLSDKTLHCGVLLHLLWQGLHLL